MTIPQPENITLISELSERFQEGPFSEFELAMYERKARKLQKVSPEAGLCALGMIACFRGDAQKMRSYHERAIQASGGSATYKFNYGSSLNTMGFKEKSFTYFLQSAEGAQENTRHLNRAIVLSFELDTPHLQGLLERWEKLTQQEHPIVLEMKSRELTRFCMNASTPSLEEVWGGQEEAEAWAHLQ